jgi:hypothetical protein
MSIKRYIAFLMLSIISFKVLVVPFVYLDFELHKTYIINHLCENRFKPQLHCDGKCYLAKQLQIVAQEHARSETEKQAETIKKSMSDVFDETFFPVKPIFAITKAIPSQTPYLEHSLSDFCILLFHPPSA